MMRIEAALALGPATVVRAAGRRALVRRPEAEGEEWAQIALSFPYPPVPGDVVLVVAQEERAYVIGVLQGRGPAVLPFAGDVTIAAPEGRIALVAGKGVTVAAPEVEVKAESVEVEAKTLVQRLENAFQWVKDLFQLRAGRTRTVVDGTHHQVAERTYIRSEKETKVDGERVYLG
jgi:hypothetical protein